MLIDTIRQDMNKALKAGWASEKLTLSMLLGALQLKEKEKRAPLVETDELDVLAKEIKQIRETIETASNRYDIIESALSRLKVLEKYLPAQMTEEEIILAINTIIFNGPIMPIKANKGKIMKELTPITKGKADGKFVNKIVDSMLS